MVVLAAVVAAVAALVHQYSTRQKLEGQALANMPASQSQRPRASAKSFFSTARCRLFAGQPHGALSWR